MESYQVEMLMSQNYMVRTNLTGGNIRVFTEYLVKQKLGAAKWALVVEKNQEAFNVASA